jgi:hypothetical protein
MRLADGRIKEGLLHPDREVRTAIAYYYSRAFSRDPTIMPLVIQAIDRYGLENAFDVYNFLRELVQTEESVCWLIDQLRQPQPMDNERALQRSHDLQTALIHSDPLWLQNFEQQINDLDALDDESRDAVDEQLSLPSQDVSALWRDLEELCALYPDDASMPEEMFDFGGRLAKALAQHPEDVTERVLTILQGDSLEEDYWETGFAIRIAGEMRLESCIPRLVELGHDDDDWIMDEAFEALVKIGTAGVVAQLAGQFAEGGGDFRHATACYLEHIHTDFSVEAALQLFAIEEVHAIRCSLLQSALMNFATESIEPARQYVLACPKDPELLEVRDCVLLFCKLSGERIPEFDAWLEDSKTDQEFRRQWFVEHRLARSESNEEDDEPSDDDLIDDDGLEPPLTLVRHGARVGRNDPCPCGSEKKFKKCCYGKELFDNETDIGHIGAMSGVVPRRFVQKYPLGTIALYGPDDLKATKIVVGIIRREGAEPLLERWVGSNLKDNPKVQRQIGEFLQKHGVKSVVASDGNMGCPHEEGEDFPVGEDCPFCPFWKGKQGSARQD